MHQRHDLLGVHLAERAADDGEILAEGGDDATADVAGADHDAVGRQHFRLHAEVAGRMLDMGALFLEGALLEQRVEPVARGHQAFCVARRELVGAAAFENRFAASAHVL